MGDPSDCFFAPSIIMRHHLRNFDSSQFLFRSDQLPHRVCNPRISYGAGTASGMEKGFGYKVGQPPHNLDLIFWLVLPS